MGATLEDGARDGAGARAGSGPGAPAVGAPHSPQNLSSGRSARPQAGHV
jgi:hypothetical protein